MSVHEMDVPVRSTIAKISELHTFHDSDAAAWMGGRSDKSTNPSIICRRRLCGLRVNPTFHIRRIFMFEGAQHVLAISGDEQKTGVRIAFDAGSRNGSY